MTLANLAAGQSETGEYQQRMAELRNGEFGDLRLPAGAREDRTIFFPAPSSQADLRGVDVVVPVVDLEQATWYLVRLPVGERAPVFEPYSVKPGGS